MLLFLVWIAVFVCNISGLNFMSEKGTAAKIRKIGESVLEKLEEGIASRSRNFRVVTSG
jgi:hypothetical protein